MTPFRITAALFLGAALLAAFSLTASAGDFDPGPQPGGTVVTQPDPPAGPTDTPGGGNPGNPGDPGQPPGGGNGPFEPLGDTPTPSASSTPAATATPSGSATPTGSATPASNTLASLNADISGINGSNLSGNTAGIVALPSAGSGGGSALAGSGLPLAICVVMILLAAHAALKAAQAKD